uniref:Uncharacterized protein n=1 Tax=Lactuca sativa TaxID=4236 RepID=A0A9R1VIT7_LACSA|nr:hypothetical protein LSAT_V11C500295350 [Lactuca sativa]
MLLKEFELELEKESVRKLNQISYAEMELELIPESVLFAINEIGIHCQLVATATTVMVLVVAGAAGGGGGHGSGDGDSVGSGGGGSVISGGGGDGGGDG